MKLGDLCQARCTAPARYLADGICVFVSAMENSLHADLARLPLGNENMFPLPRFRTLKKILALMTAHRCDPQNAIRLLDPAERNER